MAYLGQVPNKSVTTPTSQYFNGDGSTTAFTLNRGVNYSEELEVFVDNIQQEPGTGKSYTASGTTLTFDEAPATGTGNIYVIYRGQAQVGVRLEHDANASISATDGTFSGDVTAVDGTFSGDVIISGAITGTTGTGSGVPLRIADESDQGATFGIQNDGDLIIDAETKDIAFQTNDTERVRIDADGDVGINEANPETRLHITDNTANDGPVIMLEGSGQNSANSLLGGINFKNNDTSGDGPTVTGAIRHYSSSSTGSGGYFTFHTHDGSEGGEGSGAPERMRILAGGGVSIGQTDGNGKLNITSGSPVVRLRNNAGTSGYFTMVTFRNNAGSGEVGSITRVNDASIAYNTSSDHRLKENVEDLTGAITRVKNLQPKRFNFISDTTDTLIDGFMAHEAQTVVPEAVTGTHNEVDDDGNPVYQGIDQSKLVPLLTGALQEAIAKIEALETRVQALENS